MIKEHIMSYVYKNYYYLIYYYEYMFFINIIIELFIV